MTGTGRPCVQMGRADAHFKLEFEVTECRGRGMRVGMQTNGDERELGELPDLAGKVQRLVLVGRSREKLEIETALHKALERGELVLHYQPVVTLNGWTLPWRMMCIRMSASMQSG